VLAVMRNAQRRPPEFECLELTLRRGRFQLRAEWFSHRREDNRHVPGRRSGFISPNMPHPGIDIPLPLGDHLGRASWVAALVKRHLALDDLDEDRPGVGMPPGRTSWRVVM